MLTFALFGAGRIGSIHASNLAALPGVTLKYVVDVNPGAAHALARQHGATVADQAQALRDPAVDAVIVASSTDTHAELVTNAARSGKAIFCEKPIDLSIPRVHSCLQAVEAAQVPLFVGFNRRFDPSFSSLHAGVTRLAIGAVEQVIITSRDPAPPPLDYLRVSGGQFRDMTIHDFDLARWLLGEDPAEVFAYGSCLIDQEIGRSGDTDTLMVLMKTASGRQCHINNSRRTTYGYDQRVEVHGATGRLSAGNRTPTSVEWADAAGVRRDKPLHFFLERYAEAYRIEMAAFVGALAEGRPMPVTGNDGLQALILAEAAAQSLRCGRPVRCAEASDAAVRGEADQPR